MLDAAQILVDFEQRIGTLRQQHHRMRLEHALPARHHRVARVATASRNAVALAEGRQAVHPGVEVPVDLLAADAARHRHDELLQVGHQEAQPQLAGRNDVGHLDRFDHVAGLLERPSGIAQRLGDAGRERQARNLGHQADAWTLAAPGIPAESTARWRHMAANARLMSPTHRASGPCTDASGASAGVVGLKPATPQCSAGNRIEPAMSLPWPIAQMPVATAAAAPPEEPPHETLGSQGFSVSP